MVAIIPQVEASKPTPEFPLRYGLFAAAVGPLDFPDIHMRGGGLWYPEAMCGGGQGYEINCIDDLEVKDFNDLGINIVTGLPFVVMSNFTCMFTNLADAEAWARQKFFSVEQAVVESIYSEGLFGAAPALATNPDLINLDGIDAGATTVTDSLSILERAIYCTSQYGPAAYIHVPIPVFNRMKLDHLIDFDGQRWRTPMGSVIVAGCIFSESPDDSGTFQMYATGQTTVWRTAANDVEQIPVQGALNRTTNQYTGLVEREYIVTFECAVYQRTVTLWPVAP